jgi:hypothetical protein
MVRFSDLLSGGNDPDDGDQAALAVAAPRADDPFAALGPADEPFVDEPAPESAEEILERLLQYAEAARQVNRTTTAEAEVEETQTFVDVDAGTELEAEAAFEEATFEEATFEEATFEEATFEEAELQREIADEDEQAAKLDLDTPVADDLIPNKRR